MDSEKAFYESPVGTLAITLKHSQVSEIAFLNNPEKSTEPASATMKFLLAELDAYFAGTLKSFETEVIPEGTDFEIKVWKELRNIPYGKTQSYKDIALKLGDVQLVRAVGGANGRNNIPLLIPCHRVIGEDGSLTGFSGGLQKKSWLLEHEGAIAEQLHLFS